MFPFFRLGPFLLQLPGLALLGGLWLGLSQAEREAARLKLDAAAIYNLTFYGLIAGVAGARLAYAARYWSIYLANPFSLLALTPATLYPDAGLAIGMAVAVYFGWRRHLPLRPTLDALAPGLAIFLVAFGIAHFLSGDAFARPRNFHGPSICGMTTAIPRKSTRPSRAFWCSSWRVAGP